MKKLVFLLLLASLTAFTGLTHAADDDEQTKSKIELEEDYPPPVGTRSGGDVITATFDADGIDLIFHRSFGRVEIVITGDTEGEVYRVTVDTGTQSSLFVSLQGLPQGVYTITFSHQWGSLQGVFEL